MEDERFKFGICHVRRVGRRVDPLKVVNPRVIFKGYLTPEIVKETVIPELAAMSQRGRKDIAFPLGIYIYAYWGRLAYPSRRLYVQEIPDKSIDLLRTTWKAVYFIDEQHQLFAVCRDHSLGELI